MSAASPPSLGVALITGGGGGIGAAIAQLAGARGYHVAVNYRRNAAGAEAVVAAIRAAGGDATALQADVAKEADVDRLFAAVDALGPLTALVNNSGVTGGFSRVEDLSIDVLTQVLAVNVIGPFLCSRNAVRRMSTRHGGAGGAIVNISSRAAQLGGAGEWVHYAATKGALDTLTIGLAREAAAEGVRVNAVAPGLINTELHATSGRPDRVATMAPTVPMGRAGAPLEVAECALWLMSPSSAYVTGAILPVSGGR